MAKSEQVEAETGGSIEEQAQQQTGNRQVRLRVDQRDLHQCYANAFRPNATTEEIIVDFGLNQLVPTGRPPGEGDDAQNVDGEIIFQISSRVIMNYYTAKRLAMSLGQMIRRYEQQFGELKLNAADRAKS